MFFPWDNNRIDTSRISSDAILSGTKGLLSFASGAWTGAAGLWDIPKNSAPGFLTLCEKVALNSAIGTGWKLSADLIYYAILGEDCAWANGLATIIEKIF